MAGFVLNLIVFLLINFDYDCHTNLFGLDMTGLVKNITKFVLKRIYMYIHFICVNGLKYN